MAATSVSGRGPGESNGEPKPELHSGCGYVPPPEEEEPETPRKRGCVVKNQSGGSIQHKAGGSSSIKVC